ncbi:MAG TPA: GNAT family N-acetyltransferase [Kofleriaceae bacterium]
MVIASAFATARFAVRRARVDDARAIADVQVASWRSSYRGILPDSILDSMNAELRVGARQGILRDAAAHNLVAYDTTHGDVVGFANASVSRRGGPRVGELFELYLVDRAKRYGLGRELFETVIEWSRAQQHARLDIWVLEGNQHARRFYAAMGGVVSAQTASRVRGFGVIELAYSFRL